LEAGALLGAGDGGGLSARAAAPAVATDNAAIAAMISVR
jgi:hypothetical protein